MVLTSILLTFFLLCVYFCVAWSKHRLDAGDAFLSTNLHILEQLRKYLKGNTKI